MDKTQAAEKPIKHRKNEVHIMETEVTNSTNTTEVNAVETTPQADNDSKPTVEELLAQLAAERAANAKNKQALDKALKEKGDVTKALRAKQTAEEQEAEAKAEAEKLQAEKFENMSKELNHMKAVNAYQKVIGNGKDIDSLIEAVADADHSLIATVIANEVQRQVKEAKAEWLKSRPAINAGGGEESTITQEQFNKMNYHERVEFKNKNPELYKKFTE